MKEMCHLAKDSKKQIQKAVQGIKKFPKLEDLMSQEVKDLPKKWNMAEDLTNIGNIEANLQSAKLNAQKWNSQV